MSTHETTTTIPRGSLCKDKRNVFFVVWPDGSYAVCDGTGMNKIPAHITSRSFGPYSVIRQGLDEPTCDQLSKLTTGGVLSFLNANI